MALRTADLLRLALLVIALYWRPNIWLFVGACLLIGWWMHRNRDSYAKPPES